MPLDYKREYFRYKQYYLKKAQALYKQPAVKASVSLIFSLLTISFFAFLAIKPTLTTIAGLIKELKDQKTVDQSLHRKINDLTKAQATYLAVEPDIHLVEKALPEDPQFIKFTQKLNFLSFKHTLLITAFNFNEFNLFGGGAIELIKEKEKKAAKEAKATSDAVKPEKTEPIPITFDITLAGKYQNIRDFLVDLENLDRLLEIDSVSFSTKSDIQGTLKFKISGKAFYF